MQRNFAAACRVYILPLLACLSACGTTVPAAQQAQVQQALAVACTVDGVLVPIAQPIVATMGPGGAAAAGADVLLVHPAVVAACTAIHGVPASVTAVSAPVTAAPAATSSPVG
jgi:hypothetical protein